MNRRLYFMLPDTESAHAMMNDLLLARVNSNRIHFLAKPGVEIGDLPAASIVERTDFLEGWEIGTLLGGLLGLVAGLMAVWIPPCSRHILPTGAGGNAMLRMFKISRQSLPPQALQPNQPTHSMAAPTMVRATVPPRQISAASRRR